MMYPMLQRRLAVLATALIVVWLTGDALTQARWTKAAPFPEPEEELYGVTVKQWSFFSSMPSPQHGVAGVVLGNRFHLVSGMVTSGAAAAGGDPDVHLHTKAHDIIELPDK